jgi:hypothetical protein
MRFSIVVALLVATFAVCFSSFASAEQNNLRRLKSGDIKLTEKYSDAAADEERDTSKLVSKFATNLKKATAEHNPAGRVAAALKQNDVMKMGNKLAEVAVKDPKKWSTLKKVIVGTLGTAGAAAVIAVASTRSRATLLRLLLPRRLRPVRRPRQQSRKVSFAIARGECKSVGVSTSVMKQRPARLYFFRSPRRVYSPIGAYYPPTKS